MTYKCKECNKDVELPCSDRDFCENREASSGNSELLCVCQGGWMCPNCRDKLEFENHEMKRRIDEACRMMREGDFSLEMSAVGDEFLMMVSQQIQAIKHT